MPRRPQSTTSPEAERFLVVTKPLQIGRLTPAYARAVRERRTQELKPIVDRLRATLTESVERREVAGVPVEVITPKGEIERDAAALYLHGGAYAFGSAFDIPAMLMASALKMPVHSIDYRMAPEHRFPTALDDAMAAYGKLIRTFDPARLVGFGVSAGGGLLLALLLEARRKGLPLPAGVALLTPWSDLTLIGDSYAVNDGRDALLTRNGQLDKAARAYVGKADPKSPLLSPVYADYRGAFPQTLITTGTRDLFLSDCTRLYRVMKRAGVPVTISIFEGMWHAFNVVPGIPEADESRAEIAGFLRATLARQGRKAEAAE